MTTYENVSLPFRIMGRDSDVDDLVQDRPSWKKVNEIYKKYSRGQNMGELAQAIAACSWTDRGTAVDERWPKLSC